jgi:hypothetical protein
MVSEPAVRFEVREGGLRAVVEVEGHHACVLRVGPSLYPLRAPEKPRARCRIVEEASR